MSTEHVAERELIKMSELAKRSDVPAATIKHYIREGLLSGPAKRTSRNMAYYDAAMVPRIKRIKQLQRTRYLPLKVIRDILGNEELNGAAGEYETLNETILTVLRLDDTADALTESQLVEEGVEQTDIDWLATAQLVRSVKIDGEVAFGGDDLRLIRILSRSRKAGITPEMLPPQILGPYVQAISDLVRLELAMFREGVIPRATDDLTTLIEEAAKLSEELVIVLRRKLLVPTLRAMRGPTKIDEKKDS